MIIDTRSDANVTAKDFVKRNGWIERDWFKRRIDGTENDALYSDGRIILNVTINQQKTPVILSELLPTIYGIISSYILKYGKWNTYKKYSNWIET